MTRWLRLQCCILSGVLLIGCRSADVVAPASKIAGTYALRSINGTTPPTAATIPTYGAVNVVSGSALLDPNGTVMFVINVTALSAGSPALPSLAHLGTIVPSGPDYLFKFEDGSSAQATCGATTCTVTYQGNVYGIGLLVQ